MYGGLARAKGLGAGADGTARFGDVLPALPHPLLDIILHFVPPFDINLRYPMSNEDELYKLFPPDLSPCIRYVFPDEVSAGTP